MKIVAARRPDSLPRFIFDPSFEQPTAISLYDPEKATDVAEFKDTFLPDDVTRDLAKRMHYAAWRLSIATRRSAAQRWRQCYFDLRDRVVIGNRKLVYRAVRRRMAMWNAADDLIGDCHIVLIHAVAAYNPWLGIRFSTYAFTCLVRALSRKAQQASKDWFAHSAPLDALPDGEPGENYEPELSSSSTFGLDEFLRDDHPLLTSREKTILSRRFNFSGSVDCPTLEIVGRELGLSKERVRQVQATALGKLRAVLLGKGEIS